MIRVIFYKPTIKRTHHQFLNSYKVVEEKVMERVELNTDCKTIFEAYDEAVKHGADPFKNIRFETL